MAEVFFGTTERFPLILFRDAKPYGKNRGGPGATFHSASYTGWGPLNSGYSVTESTISKMYIYLWVLCENLKAG